MALPINTLEVQFGAESSFAEDSTSYTTHIPVLSEPRVTINHERMPDPSLRARMNVQGLSHIGAKAASLEFETYWPGHITPTTGSLTQTWVQDLLSDGLGGGNTAQVGGTVNTPTSASQFSLTSATAVAGAVMRLGSKGDARGDGQPGVVNNAATTTFLTAFPAQPNAADVVYATQMAYHDESVSASLGTKRFMVGRTTSGCQYHLRGGQLAGLSINMTPGPMPPRMTWRYEFAYYKEASVSIPSATAIESHDCAPVSGGSFFIQDFGTATRNTLNPSEVSLSLDIGLAPIIGPSGAVYADQYIVGWQRTRCMPSLSILIPWSTTYSTWWETVNNTIAYKHILWANTVDAGQRSTGFYLPRVFPIGPRPTVDEWNQQTYQRVTFGCTESTTTTSELTRSAVRFFAG